jgi:hypothetical protein
MSARQGVDFVAFVDEATRRSLPAQSTWAVHPIESGELPPERAAKRCKILPHRLFPHKQYSLWIDSTILIRYPFGTPRLVASFLADADLCLFRHTRRRCLFEEAEWCCERGRDDASLIQSQVARYRREGHPPSSGLAEATVLLRRHTPSMAAFDEAWWGEIERGSWRDQISFPYLVRQRSFSPSYFPTGLHSQNGLFQKHTRVAHHQP